MNQLLVQDPVFIGLVVVVVVQLIVQVASNRRFKKQLKALEQSVKQYKSDISADIHAANQGAIGVGKRLLRVEKLLRQQVEAPKILEDIRKELSSFELADSLILKGETPSKVVEQTGVSLAEAQLLKLLNESDGRKSLN